VSIVGWSLGGIYARHLAATQAKAIRTIVTLGAPVRSAVEQTSHAHSVYTALRRLHADHSFALDEGSPLAVPVTAIHTRTDAIVHWRTCLVDPAPNAENLRVRGSHVGLGFNPAVMYIIADRLSQAPGRWAPFHAPLPYRRIITRVSVA
jgi:pimeloyl-ACP methyl ester carboxylesterase